MKFNVNRLSRITFGNNTIFPNTNYNTLYTPPPESRLQIRVFSFVYRIPSGIYCRRAPTTIRSITDNSDFRPRSSRLDKHEF